MSRMSIHWMLAAAVLASGTASAQIQFSAPVAITDAAQKFQLSRNPSKNIAYDGAGRLHLAYFAGSGINATPATPSTVFYRRLEGGSWSPAETLDESFVGPDRIGGRHPSLVVDATGNATVAWHDSRHCTPANTWIDNLELYMDRRPVSGTFGTDIRLTTTTAGGVGDNSYMARLAAGPDGRLHLAWYDFTANAAVSDVYLRTSDTSGVFADEPISNARLTNFNDRGGSTAFTLPDVAVTPDGTRHLVWMTNTLGFGGAIFHASVAASGVSSTPQSIATGVASFFDPPRLAVDPSGAAIHIVYTDNTSETNTNLLLRSSTNSGASFTLRSVTTGAGNQRQPAAAVDSTGRLHLAWVDDPTSSVVYTTFDGSTFAAPLTVATGLAVVRISMAVDGADNLAIVVEEDLGFSSGRLWYIRGAVPMAAGIWAAYE